MRLFLNLPLPTNLAQRISELSTGPPPSPSAEALPSPRRKTNRPDRYGTYAEGDDDEVEGGDLGEKADDDFAPGLCLPRSPTKNTELRIHIKIGLSKHSLLAVVNSFIEGLSKLSTRSELL